MISIRFNQCSQEIRCLQKCYNIPIICTSETQILTNKPTTDI